jgi:cysteine desulfurase/selenocysteine lyase
VLSEDSRRKSFPTLQGMTYLNTAAEGIPPLEVREALLQYFHDKQLGMDGRPLHAQQFDAVKELTAPLFGLSAGEIGICACSSEAFNLAALALRLREGDEVIINDLDFPSGSVPWVREGSSATVRLWRSRQGALRVEDLVALLGPKTRLVTTSLVSFYNGFRIPLPAVMDAVRAGSSALLAVDVTQALGRIPLELKGVDLIVSSTHKWILASHGGGLVGVPRARERDWTVPPGGWFHLEDAFGPDRFERAVSRPGASSFTLGMPNYPALYAIRAGLEYITRVGVAEIDRTTRPLVSACLEGLARLPVELLTPNDESEVAGILAFRHPRADDVARHLRSKDIHIMCHAGRLRVALHGYNTQADVETLLRELSVALRAVG